MREIVCILIEQTSLIWIMDIGKRTGVSNSPDSDTVKAKTYP